MQSAISKGIPERLDVCQRCGTKMVADEAEGKLPFHSRNCHGVFREAAPLLLLPLVLLIHSRTPSFLAVG